MADTHDDAAMADYYGRRAPLYDHMYRNVGPDLRTPMLDELIATVSGRRVLELASGTGFWSEWLAPFYARLVGVDIAPEMLAIARARPIAPGKAEFRCPRLESRIPLDGCAKLQVANSSYVLFRPD